MVPLCPRIDRPALAVPAPVVTLGGAPVRAAPARLQLVAAKCRDSAGRRAVTPTALGRAAGERRGMPAPSRGAPPVSPTGPPRATTGRRGPQEGVSPGGRLIRGHARTARIGLPGGRRRKRVLSDVTVAAPTIPAGVRRRQGATPPAAAVPAAKGAAMACQLGLVARRDQSATPRWDGLVEVEGQMVAARCRRGAAAIDAIRRTLRATGGRPGLLGSAATIPRDPSRVHSPRVVHSPRGVHSPRVVHSPRGVHSPRVVHRHREGRLPPGATSAQIGGSRTKLRQAASGVEWRGGGSVS